MHARQSALLLRARVRARSRDRGCPCPGTSSACRYGEIVERLGAASHSQTKRIAETDRSGGDGLTGEYPACRAPSLSGGTVSSVLSSKKTGGDRVDACAVPVGVS